MDDQSVQIKVYQKMVERNVREQLNFYRRFDPAKDVSQVVDELLAREHELLAKLCAREEDQTKRAVLEAVSKWLYVLANTLKAEQKLWN